MTTFRSRLWFSACVLCWFGSAQAMDIVRDNIPVGHLMVAPGDTSVLYLDINPKDTLQWSWDERGGQTQAFRTQLIWTDETGEEHALDPDARGFTVGTFKAPANLLGARLEWHNASDADGEILWAYHSTAFFWKRPELFLPALLPLFLLAGAFYFGKRLDRRGAPRPMRLINELNSKESLA